MSNEPFKKENSSYLSIQSWKEFDQRIITGFSTRNGGVSQEPFNSLNLGLHVEDDPNVVVKNREILASTLKIPLEKWVCAEQVHKANIQKVSQDDTRKGVYELKSAIRDTDGLYTDEFNVCLTTGYADCVPLYFYSPSAGLVGLAHAGWKGTVANIAGEMIKSWVNNEKVAIEDIFCVIGPSIGSCCYLVDDHVITKVNQVINGKAEDVYTPVASNQYKLDLKQLNVKLMVQAGMDKNQIEMSTYCTSCEPELFFSHRRDKGKTGRMLSFIMKKEEHNR